MKTLLFWCLLAVIAVGGEPVIQKFQDSTLKGPGPLDGYYFICRERTLTPYEVYEAEVSAGPINPKVREFLHKDGKWRHSTFHNGWSGYYKTHEDAKRTLEKVSPK